jgi:hypothetical protein
MARSRRWEERCVRPHSERTDEGKRREQEGGGQKNWALRPFRHSSFACGVLRLARTEDWAITEREKLGRACAWRIGCRRTAALLLAQSGA